MARTITFLLPFAGVYPVGGFKVVYEYANKLAAENYHVNIIYPATVLFDELPTKLRIRGIIRFLYRYIFGNFTCKKWFSLHTKVKEIWVFSLKQQHISESDVYIATAWVTAEYLAAFQNTSKKKLFYLIQSYEDWGNTDEARLLKTWKAPLHKIVIAPWLKDIAIQLGEEVSLIENGFDFNYFKIVIPIADRNPYCICMMYSKAELKGFDDGMKALEKVKKLYPRLIVNLFGVPNMDSTLPDWIHYFRNPNQITHNGIYNEAAIYVGPSHKEGFGLTVGEAMQSGCAVVCTNNGGYSVMAKHDKTALISPVKDIDALATNIIQFIENQGLRICIAQQGNEFIQQFTWKRSYTKFIEVINNK
jgi:glycosyltransferase involved in cell wall biosynthesis